MVALKSSAEQLTQITGTHTKHKKLKTHTATHGHKMEQFEVTYCMPTIRALCMQVKPIKIAPLRSLIAYNTKNLSIIQE